MPSASAFPSTSPRSAQKGRSSGFSLAEVLIGTVILAFAVAMAAAMHGVASYGLLGSTTINDRDALVDGDVAEIRALAERLSWCSGTGALQATAPCQDSNPGSRDYYAPAASMDDEANMNQFEAACTNGTLNTTLLAAINARPALPGINRAAQNAEGIGTTTNGILIRYTSPDDNENPVSRSVVITPTVAAWCP